MATKRSAKELTDELLSSVDLSFSSQAVIPGDDVTSMVTRQTKKIQLGGGLYHDSKLNTIKAVRSGILKYSPPATYWVENKSMKRYVAVTEDAVIGIVEERCSTFYRINLYGTLPATLPLLAFEGATKRTKPTLKVGDAVYMRIVSAPRDIEPECSCIAVHGDNRKGWETGEATFGVLEGGIMLRCTLSQASSLKDSKNLNTIAIYQALEREKISFEIVVGSNGVVWIKSGNPRVTICVSNAIQNSFVLEASEVKNMVKKVLEVSKDRPDKEDEEEEEEEEEEAQ